MRKMKDKGRKTREDWFTPVTEFTRDGAKTGYVGPSNSRYKALWGTYRAVQESYRSRLSIGEPVRLATLETIPHDRELTDELNYQIYCHEIGFGTDGFPLPK